MQPTNLEKCLEMIPSRLALATVATKRWEQLKHGARPMVESANPQGMGAVFKAEHLIMQRVVALKVINRALLANPTMIDRFRREAQAAARLAPGEIRRPSRVPASSHDRKD